MPIRLTATKLVAFDFCNFSNFYNFYNFLKT